MGVRRGKSFVGRNNNGFAEKSGRVMGASLITRDVFYKTAGDSSNCGNWNMGRVVGIEIQS